MADLGVLKQGFRVFESPEGKDNRLKMFFKVENI